MFEPVCQKYHIPIATGSGWQSMLQRAIYSRRFKEAQDRGLQCVLLYAGDFDPDGLRISEFLRKNLEDLKSIRWEDGVEGYDPTDLLIRRFGLSYEFITQHKLTWIDNLYTGAGHQLAINGPNGTILPGKTKDGKPHKNFKMQYMQDYLRKYGCRKCEANALVIRPDAARQLVESQIKILVGDDAVKRFDKKSAEVKRILDDFREKTGMTKSLKKALEQIRKNEKDDE